MNEGKHFNHGLKQSYGMNSGSVHLLGNMSYSGFPDWLKRKSEKNKGGKKVSFEDTGTGTPVITKPSSTGDGVPNLNQTGTGGAIQNISQEIKPPVKDERVIPDLSGALMKKMEQDKLPPVPPKPDVTGLTKQRAAVKMRKYYAENKAAILETVEKVGKAKARKHWNIGSSTLNYRLKAWAGKAPKYGKETKSQRQSIKVSKSDTTIFIPAFPEFNKDWNADQMKVYFDARAQELARVGGR